MEGTDTERLRLRQLEEDRGIATTVVVETATGTDRGMTGADRGLRTERIRRGGGAGVADCLFGL